MLSRIPWELVTGPLGSSENIPRIAALDEFEVAHIKVCLTSRILDQASAAVHFEANSDVIMVSAFG
jgi:hypothetical protein